MNPAQEFFQNLIPYGQKVHSQTTEDGILERIFQIIGTTNKFCVDLGASPNGWEFSNTKKLTEEGWDRFAVDGGAEPNSGVFREWITVENVNSILDRHGVPREIDLLSIDLDGNDWWIWQRVQTHSRVAIMEINTAYPQQKSVTIAYNPDHVWDKTSYYGATPSAFKKLGFYKGMKVVWFNHINAIFVAQEELPQLFDLEIAYNINAGHPMDKSNRAWIQV